MKRFTDTEKWRDPWYRELPPRLKCLWQFFCDTCDHAGVFQIDWKLASFEIGERVTERDLEVFGERLQLLPSGRYLIKKFVPFQSGNLTDSCPAHKPILKLVSQHGLVQTSIGYQYPIARVFNQVDYCYPMGYPMPYPTVRVQEKEKEKESTEGGAGETLEIPEKLAKNDQFLENWSDWKRHRKAKGGCKDFGLLFKRQIKWLSTFDVPTAIEILDKSLRNGYTGLLEPNQGAINGKHISNTKQSRGPSRTEGTYNANPRSLEHLVQTGTPRLPNLE